MIFEVARVREAGRLRPRHLLWTGAVRGELRVEDIAVEALSRRARVARILGDQRQDLLPPLHDLVLLSAKRDWWTMTGWELIADPPSDRAYQQTWLMVPAEAADRERARSQQATSGSG